jgi:hypothetical protein
MATVYEIIQGLAQAAANAYDGALGEDYEPEKPGILRREEGNALIDQRVMDGFNVRFFGNKMILSYQSEIKLKEVYSSGFESDMEQRIEDIAGWLKKEYKKIIGSSVSLQLEGEVDIRVENTSRVRSWVTAISTYIIKNSDAETVPQYSKDTVEESWKSFLDLGGWNGKGGKRPENDTRKKGTEVEKK